MASNYVINDNYILVEDDQTLNDLCQLWQDSHYLAMDTEFIRTSTFYPHVGLIQINAGAGNYLIDPLKINDWEAFKALMTRQSITKIFHSCSEDLQVFMVKLQLIPSPVFDTQIGAAFLNEGFGNSYHALVVDCFDIDLPKGETRSDWLQRPLQDKQLHYAAQDVAYLPTIYMKQLKLLEEKGRLPWFQQECESLLNTYRKEMDADFFDYYLNIRGAWQLNSPQLHILRQLAQWREVHARKRDKPRNWIIKDKNLIDIARLMPDSFEQLGLIDDLSHNFLRHEGQEILDLVVNALAEPDEGQPVTLPQPLDGKAKSRLKKAQQYAEKKSIELDLPVEILIRKRWLITMLQDLSLLEESPVASPEDRLLPQELAGWRKDLLFPGLIESMR